MAGARSGSASSRASRPSLEVGPEPLRKWVRQAEVNREQRAGTSIADSQRIAELEWEVRELRRANEILKIASAAPAEYEAAYWADLQATIAA
jgi:transposase